ncbi:MAG: TetR/AcrR family transcriptional regulator [Burkholderiaceae bacterium]
MNASQANPSGRTRALVHNRDREREVLAAAHRVFVERGFSRATIAEIATLARVAEGTIYRFAATKRELLERVIVDWYRGLMDQLRAQLEAAPDTRERLRLFCRHQFTIFTDHAAVSRLLVRELRASADYRNSPLHEANRAYTKLFIELIESGQAARELRGDLSTTLLRDLFFGTIEHATLAGPDARTRADREAEFFGFFWSLVVQPNDPMRHTPNRPA